MWDHFPHLWVHVCAGMYTCMLRTGYFFCGANIHKTRTQSCILGRAWVSNLESEIHSSSLIKGVAGEQRAAPGYRAIGWDWLTDRAQHMTRVCQLPRRQPTLYLQDHLSPCSMQGVVDCCSFAGETQGNYLWAVVTPHSQMRRGSSIDVLAGAPTPSAWGSYEGTRGREMASKDEKEPQSKCLLGFLSSYLEMRFLVFF